MFASTCVLENEQISIIFGNQLENPITGAAFSIYEQILVFSLEKVENLISNCKTRRYM